MHAHMPKKQVEKYRIFLKEGEVYVIKNLLVITNFF